MLTKLRTRMESEQGFTLIELLVVILIIGILAAIAIPSFLNQREKGQDACAKAQLRTAETAMETFFTDYNGYNSATIASLHAIESQVPDTTTGGCPASDNFRRGATATGASCADAAPAATAYCVYVESSGGPARPYIIARSSAGVITRTCGVGAGGTANTATGNGGGCASGTW